MDKKVNVQLLNLDTGKVEVAEVNSFTKMQKQFGFDKRQDTFRGNLGGFLWFCEKEGWWLTDDMHFNVQLFETGAIFKFYKRKNGLKVPILTGGCGSKDGHKNEIWPVLTSRFPNAQKGTPSTPYIAWYRESSDGITDEDYQNACMFNSLFASLYFHL